MKYILGALAAVTLLIGMTASQPAEARCFWNGFAMECFHHPHFGYWHRGWDRPYGGGWDRPYVEPFYRGY